MRRCRIATRKPGGVSHAHHGTAKADANRRILLTQSRRPTAPARLAYEWNPETGAFAVVADPRDHAFDENWQTVRGILEGFEEAVSQREIEALWPDDSPKPALSTLYAWLHRAHARKLVHREGRGIRTDPWSYRLDADSGDQGGESDQIRDEK